MHDAGEPVVADDAAPEGVVEVEHQALLRLAAGGGDEPCHQLAVHRPRLRRDLHLRLQPAHRIVPGIEPVARGDAGEVEEEHPLGGGGIGERGVQAPDQPCRRPGHAGIEPAEERRLEIEEGLLDDESAETAGAGPERPEVGQGGGDARIRRLGRGGERHGAEEVAGGEGEQHRVGAEGREAARIEELLAVLPVAAGVGGDAQAAAQAADPDPGQQMIDGSAGEQRQPYGLENGPGSGLGAGGSAGERRVELQRLEERKPGVAERDELLEAALRAPVGSGETAAEVLRRRQPVHSPYPADVPFRHWARRGPA